MAWAIVTWLRNRHSDQTVKLTRGDGKGGTGSAVRLWDAADPADPALVTILADLPGPVNAVAFSPDGHLLAAAVGDFDSPMTSDSDLTDTIRVWNVADPAHPIAVATLTGLQYAAVSVAFSPDGGLLAAGGDGDTFGLWSVADPARPLSLVTLPNGDEELNSAVWSVAFSPDTHVLLIAADPPGAGTTNNPQSIVQLWNIADPGKPTPLTAMNTDYGDPTVMAASPDGLTVAATGQPSASDGGYVRLWDIGDPSRAVLVTTLNVDTVTMLNSVAFSPDGRMLATAGADGALRLFDVTNPASPVPIVTFGGFGNELQAISFSRDGAAIAVGDGSTVHLLDTDRAGLVRRLCTGIGATITRKQWAEYVHGVPYQSRCGSGI